MIRYVPHLSRFAIACGAMLMLDAPATAQRAPSSQKTAPPQQAAPEPPAVVVESAPVKPENPGLLNEIGKLFVKPSDLFPSLKPSDAAAPVLAPTQPGDTSVATPPTIATPKIPDPKIPDSKISDPKIFDPKTAAPPVPATPAPATTATAPAGPPAAGLVPQMVQGRVTCPASANGAPDCKAGADRLCQNKGFAGGSSLGMDSAKTCSTKALLDGARHIRDICKTETFVTRAMCQ